MGWFRNLLGGNKGVLGNKDVTTVDIHGKPLRCQVCKHRYFWRHDVMLNTRATTFLDLEWMNRDAVCAVCDHSGYMHWFIPPIEAEENENPTHT